jgi:hypothetical protein
VPSKDPAPRFADIIANIERIEAYIAGIENEEDTDLNFSNASVAAGIY